MSTKQTRGIRNNNPGNIRNSERTEWLGEVVKDKKEDSSFEEFETLQKGIRAMMKLLQNYQKRHGLNTIRELIERYAPRQENDTAAYIRIVSTKMQIPESYQLDLQDKATLCALVNAMCYVENGMHLDMSDIDAAWEML